MPTKSTADAIIAKVAAKRQLNPHKRGRGLVLDWPAMRRMYEDEGASIPAITTRFRLKSKTTIVRKVAREGWTRNVRHIADKLATEHVAFHESNKVGATRGEEVSPDPITIDGEDIVPIPAVARKKRRAKAPRKPPRKPDTQAAIPKLEADVSTMLTVFNLAQRQATVRSQEIEGGDELIGLGRVIVGALLTITSPDVSASDRTKARFQLLALNPEKDGLSTLAKVALGLIDGGTRLKRRAFAMSEKGDPVPSADMKPADGPAKAILAGLAPDVLLQIRKAAYEVSKLPRQIAAPDPQSGPERP